MRKRDGYRKIQIIETDSEYSSPSISNMNKYNYFCLILIIIIIYLIIIFLLFKAFFIYAEIKDVSLERRNKKNNSKNKHKYTGKVNIINNITKTEIKSNFSEAGNSPSNTNTSKNKISLDNIPDISTDDEYSMNHFDYTDLSKEEVISFTLEAIYKNINIHTNMQYFQNKTYQEKVLNYITKLIENKTETSSSYNIGVNESSSFSDSFTSKNRINVLNVIQKGIKKSSVDRKEISSNILNLSENESKDKSIYESEKLFETKNRRMKNKNKINN